LNQDKILLLSLAVPNGPQVQSYVRQFEGVTAKNKLKTISTSIDEVKLNQATESGAISVLSTQSGSYTDLVQYVKDLENMRRPSYAARLDLLTVTSDGKKSLNITTNLKVPYILTQ
jgi:hypothetical protein